MVPNPELLMKLLHLPLEKDELCSWELSNMKTLNVALLYKKKLRYFCKERSEIMLFLPVIMENLVGNFFAWV